MHNIFTVILPIMFDGRMSLYFLVTNMLDIKIAKSRPITRLTIHNGAEPLKYKTIKTTANDILSPIGSRIFPN